MANRWSVVTESDMLSCAGVPAQALPAEYVTYVVGPSAMLVIVEVGDRPDGNAVQSVDGLALREPFPEAAAARLSSAGSPLLGFVRVPEGYVPLGRLRNAVSQHKPISIDGSPWPGVGKLTWCQLRLAERIPFDVLDQVRPTPQQPLPTLDWLRFLPDDPVAALRHFVAGWYADIPTDDGLDAQDLELPEPLLAFYRAAAGRREVFGLHNQIYTADELEYEDDGRLQFGAENQGVFIMLLDPTDADPIVQYDGLHAEQEREPLSAFLLQFLLCEASYSSPFTAFATVTEEQARLLVQPLHQILLQPMRWPGDPTRHYVTDGHHHRHHPRRLHRGVRRRPATVGAPPPTRLGPHLGAIRRLTEPTWRSRAISGPSAATAPEETPSSAADCALTTGASVTVGGAARPAAFVSAVSWLKRPQWPSARAIADTI